MEYDNYGYEEIKDINAAEISEDLTYQFPIESNMEQILFEWLKKNTPKKDVIDNLIKLVDKALDEGNKEEFYKFCRMYQHIQREYRNY